MCTYLGGLTLICNTDGHGHTGVVLIPHPKTCIFTVVIFVRSNPVRSFRRFRSVVARAISLRDLLKSYGRATRKRKKTTLAFVLTAISERT